MIETAQIIDGKAFSDAVRADVAKDVARLKEKHGLTPGLAVVLVGDDPASQVYVGSKGKKTIEVGMESFSFTLPEATTQDALLNKIRELNANPKVHGILVQLPLPKHIDEQAVIEAIDPAKDVDGFHPINTGKLVVGDASALVPCTPQGCLMMLKDALGDLSGKHAVILGRSNIVGKPMASLLLNESCTVTICHSRTKDIEAECRRADILVAAVGRPEMVKADWIKDGTTIIDVGINRIETGEMKEDGSPKTRLVGDVAFDAAREVAGAITPVPGGVGPMTIACLLANTVKAACLQHDLPYPVQ